MVLNGTRVVQQGGRRGSGGASDPFCDMLGESLHEPVTRLSHSLLLFLWAEMVFPGQSARHSHMR